MSLFSKSLSKICLVLFCLVTFTISVSAQEKSIYDLPEDQSQPADNQKPGKDHVIQGTGNNNPNRVEIIRGVAFGDGVDFVKSIEKGAFVSDKKFDGDSQDGNIKAGDRVLTYIIDLKGRPGYINYIFKADKVTAVQYDLSLRNEDSQSFTKQFRMFVDALTEKYKTYYSYGTIQYEYPDAVKFEAFKRNYDSNKYQGYKLVQKEVKLRFANAPGLNVLVYASKIPAASWLNQVQENVFTITYLPSTENLPESDLK
jgi:hypothetical protein